MFAADGYLSILGRNKDMVSTGGLNGYPKEVEGVIDGLDGIVESAVVGAPHPDFGEGVIAFVVRETDNGPDESDIIAFLSSRLANFKLPKRVLFAHELPRNTMGKVQKNELRHKVERTFS